MRSSRRAAYSCVVSRDLLPWRFLAFSRRCLSQEIFSQLDGFSHSMTQVHQRDAKERQNRYIEYFSKTHGGWISAQVIDADSDNGAIQLNVKPGVWLSVDDQRVRTRAARERTQRGRNAAATTDAGAVASEKSPMNAPTPQHRRSADSAMRSSAGGLTSFSDPSAASRRSATPSKVEVAEAVADLIFPGQAANGVSQLLSSVPAASAEHTEPRAQSLIFPGRSPGGSGSPSRARVVTGVGIYPSTRASGELPMTSATGVPRSLGPGSAASPKPSVGRAVPAANGASLPNDMGLLRQAQQDYANRYSRDLNMDDARVNSDADARVEVRTTQQRPSLDPGRGTSSQHRDTDSPASRMAWASSAHASAMDDTTPVYATSSYAAALTVPVAPAPLAPSWAANCGQRAVGELEREEASQRQAEKDSRQAEDAAEAQAFFQGFPKQSQSDGDAMPQGPLLPRLGVYSSRANNTSVSIDTKPEDLSLGQRSPKSFQRRAQQPSTSSSLLPGTPPTAALAPSAPAAATAETSSSNGYAFVTHATYGCPTCGQDGLPSFEAAVNHCRNPEVSVTFEEAGDGTPYARRVSVMEREVEVFTTKDPPTGSISASRLSPGQQRQANPQEGQKQADSERQTDAEGCVPETSGALKSFAAAENERAAAAAQAAQAAATASVASAEASAAAQAQAAAEARSKQTPLVGDAVAYDNVGNPTIVRQFDSETGAARTIVRSDDGSQRVFGESTVASLSCAEEVDADQWMNTLSNHQMRGLVHEVGQRLLEMSRTYQDRLSEYNSLKEQLNYVYFGLSEDASDKELDIAYRALAKKMHPDKNGGTEEAKEKFQCMKERYEALKKARAEEEDEDEDKPRRKKGSRDQADTDESDIPKEHNGFGGHIEDGEAPPEDLETREPRRKEAYDEDEDVEDSDKDKERTASITYDPKDRDSMTKTMWDMLQQLKHIESSTGKLGKELHKVRKSMPTTATQDLPQCSSAGDNAPTHQDAAEPVETPPPQSEAEA